MPAAKGSGKVQWHGGYVSVRAKEEMLAYLEEHGLKVGQFTEHMWEIFKEHVSQNAESPLGNQLVPEGAWEDVEE